MAKTAKGLQMEHFRAEYVKGGFCLGFLHFTVASTISLRPAGFLFRVYEFKKNVEGRHVYAT